MGGMVNRETLANNTRSQVNPFNLFKGKEARREFLGAAADPLDLTKKPEVPEPAATPPPPTMEDPSIAEARKKQADAELRRRGRRASIMTSSRGTEDALGTVNRPRASGLLGNFS